jgi:chromatin segregation and condensation protein Rec8/ScpA/Scc1 (kleisin family)
VTLLALLELVRLGQARAHQGDLFGEIVIESGSATETTADALPPATQQPMERPRMTEPDHG